MCNGYCHRVAHFSIVPVKSLFAIEIIKGKGEGAGTRVFLEKKNEKTKKTNERRRKRK